MLTNQNAKIKVCSKIIGSDFRILSHSFKNVLLAEILVPVCRYTRALYPNQEKSENYWNRKEIMEEEKFQLLYFSLYADKKYTTRIPNLCWFQICNLFFERTYGCRENQLFISPCQPNCLFTLISCFVKIRGYSL